MEREKVFYSNKSDSNDRRTNRFINKFNLTNSYFNNPKKNDQLRSTEQHFGKKISFKLPNTNPRTMAFPSYPNSTGNEQYKQRKSIKLPLYHKPKLSRESPNYKINRESLYPDIQKIINRFIRPHPPQEQLTDSKEPAFITKINKENTSNNKNKPSTLIKNSERVNSSLNKSNLLVKQLSISDPRKITYSLKSQLGKGSYASVFSAFDTQLNKEIAVKVYSRSKMHSSIRQEIIMNEINILMNTNHPLIVKFYGHIVTKTEIHLKFEKLEGQSLGQFVKSQKQNLNENWIRMIIKQLIETLVYLHRIGIAHRDLKMENIYLLSEKEIRLIDFGFSLFSETGKHENLYCGTPNYMSPQMVEKIGYSPYKNDCWAVGVLLFRLLTGTFPYKSKNVDLLKEIIGKSPISYPKQLSKEAKRLISALLIRDENIRISLEEALSYKFFN